MSNLPSVKAKELILNDGEISTIECFVLLGIRTEDRMYVACNFVYV